MSLISVDMKVAISSRMFVSEISILKAMKLSDNILHLMKQMLSWILLLLALEIMWDFLRSLTILQLSLMPILTNVLEVQITGPRSPMVGGNT